MYKNKDANLTSIEVLSMFWQNNETINIKICLKTNNGQIPLGRDIPLYSSSGFNRGLRGWQHGAR